jgi:hypothetical protein
MWRPQKASSVISWIELKRELHASNLMSRHGTARHGKEEVDVEQRVSNLEHQTNNYCLFVKHSKRSSFQATTHDKMLPRSNAHGQHRTDHLKDAVWFKCKDYSTIEQPFNKIRLDDAEHSTTSNHCQLQHNIWSWRIEVRHKQTVSNQRSHIVRDVEVEG